MNTLTPGSPSKPLIPETLWKTWGGGGTYRAAWASYVSEGAPLLLLPRKSNRQIDHMSVRIRARLVAEAKAAQRRQRGIAL